MRIFLFAATFLACFAADASYSVISTSSSSVGGSFTREVAVIQDGSNSLDRFTMTRLYKTGGTPRGAVILLPGSNGNFELFEVEVTSDYTDSFAGYLADADYEVWGYSPRSKQFANGACASGSTCVVMANWGIGTIVTDVDYIHDEVVAATGFDPALVGWSLGAMTTYAVLDNDPTGYTGAVIWEGLMYSTNSTITTNAYANYLVTSAQVTACVTGNLGALCAGGALIGALQTIVANTSEPVRKLAIVAATTVPLQPPTSFTPNYTFFKGNGTLLFPVATDYVYSSYAIVLDAISTGFNPYESNAVNRDIFASLGGVDDQFIDDLGSYDEPVFLIKSGRGIGPYMQETVDLLGTDSGDITTNSYGSDFGHGDHYASASHQTYLDGPVVAWLDTLFP